MKKKAVRRGVGLKAWQARCRRMKKRLESLDDSVFDKAMLAKAAKTAKWTPGTEGSGGIKLFSEPVTSSLTLHPPPGLKFSKVTVELVPIKT